MELRKKSPAPGISQQVGPYATFGWQIAASMLFFVAAGYLLDRWLNTTPWLLLAGAMIGMVAVFVKIFVMARELDQKARRKRSTKSSAAKRNDA